MVKKRLLTPSGRMTTHFWPGPRSRAARTAECMEAPLLPPHRRPSSLMSRRAMVKESLSRDLIHLSTTLRSSTVGMKSYPVPSTS